MTKMGKINDQNGYDKRAKWVQSASKMGTINGQKGYDQQPKYFQSTAKNKKKEWISLCIILD